LRTGSHHGADSAHHPHAEYASLPIWFDESSESGDLGCRFGTNVGLSASFYNSQQFNLILVQTEAMPLMFRVQEVSGILNIHSDLIQPAPANISSSITPYLDGCVSLNSELLLVLNAEAIARSSLLQSS
jgi:chemotaxis signal transduction protein